jgi:hypothetical protein
MCPWVTATRSWVKYRPSTLARVSTRKLLRRLESAGAPPGPSKLVTGSKALSTRLTSRMCRTVTANAGMPE